MTERPAPLLSRRGLLAGLAAVPVLGAVLTGSRRLAASGPLLRPAGRGTSLDRCAACGSSDHAMLSARCPAAPEGLT